MNRVSLRALRKGTPSVKAYVATLNDQHVVPKDDAWQVKKSGADRATRQFATQKEAIEFARELALRQQAELFVHGTDGKIRERNSYGHDVFPPRG